MTDSTGITCRLCGKPIRFDYRHVSHRTGKKIPLDPATNEPHDCPVRRDQPQQQQGQQQPQQQSYQQQERRYLQCNKGCGSEIYFDANSKTESGKWIPLDKDTGQPHQCQ
jgi:hypothetical protein